MRLAIEDKRPASFRFVNARRGIGHDRAAARRLPNGLARPAVHRDDGALASARICYWAFDEFLVVLKIGQNHFVVAHNGRSATAVLAYERAKVPLPN